MSARPEYGEYATPEQVARARGMSLPEYEAELSLAQPATPRPAQANETAVPDAPPAPAAQPVVRRTSRNSFATIALLAFSLVMIFSSMRGLFTLDEQLSLAFKQQDLGPYTAGAVARTLGTIAVVAQVLLWVGALAASIAALKRGRLSWWIPLTAGVIAVIVVTALVIAAMFAEPGLMENLQQLSA